MQLFSGRQIYHGGASIYIRDSLLYNLLSTPYFSFFRYQPTNARFEDLPIVLPPDNAEDRITFCPSCARIKETEMVGEQIITETQSQPV